MKAKGLLIALLLFVCCAFAFSGCTDPYKDYTASGLQVKSIPFDYADDDFLKPYDEFGYNKAQIFTDYKSYSSYKFNLDYTEAYFELNDLLVFVVSCCSSDEMQFGEILENDGKLCPLFYRKKIGNNQPVTDDFIVMPV